MAVVRALQCRMQASVSPAAAGSCVSMHEMHGQMVSSVHV